MDLIAGGREPRRRTPRAPLAVAAALLLLAVGQAAALRVPAPLPEDVELLVPLEAFVFSTRDDGSAVVTFQLRNPGRPVRVELVSEAVTGLLLVDRTVIGEPVGFREAGLGPDADVPAFDMATGVTVVVSLAYRSQGCAPVPATPRPVDVTVSAGGTSGTVEVALPQLPDDGPDAQPGDVLEWQQVLARDLCG